MTSTIKVNNIQNQCGANIINESANTITIGASGDTVTLASGASQTGFGRTGTVDWQTTVKTGNFTAASGEGYFINTTSGAITMTLPASPSAGDIVALKDYANTFDTNNLTIGRNSQPIGGQSSDGTLSTEGIAVTLVYADSTKGWQVTESGLQSDSGTPQFITATGGTITCCGNFKIHTFTGPGTFTVSNAGNSAGSNKVDYLVVAGGGGGGNGVYAGGGGGAGGYRESSGAASGCYSRSPLGACVSALPVSAQGYPITVGAGGAFASPPLCTTPGAQGVASVAFSLTATGGGGGGSRNTPSGPANGGQPGGSGGGAGQADTPTHQTYFGAGNTPPVSPSQGNPGGAGELNPVTPTASGGGGGGGATATGGNTPGSQPNTGGAGGAGATTSISGTPTAYGGGGGGSGYNCSGAGGTGGGGTGSRYPSVAGTSGTANTGGGGGGGGSGNNHPTATPGGAGGSGIVVIRYKFQ